MSQDLRTRLQTTFYYDKIPYQIQKVPLLKHRAHKRKTHAYIVYNVYIYGDNKRRFCTPSIQTIYKRRGLVRSCCRYVFFKRMRTFILCVALKTPLPQEMKDMVFKLYFNTLPKERYQYLFPIIKKQVRGLHIDKNKQDVQQCTIDDILANV
jgi:hypothetical protein